MGPKVPRSTVLSPQDEAAIVAFRRHTLPPLDDCLIALQPSLPYLTRSSQDRCLQRHGVARLPETDRLATDALLAASLCTMSATLEPARSGDRKDNRVAAVGTKRGHRSGSLVTEPGRAARDAARYWNMAAEAHAQWPQQRLAVPDSRGLISAASSGSAKRGF